MTENSTSDDSQPSSSTKPYLIRAIYQWALDNGYTPQILVATDNQDVIVPRQYIQDGKIVLNIHPQAVTGLDLGNEYIWLSARFAGKATEITVPIAAILGIYVQEGNHGLAFEEDNTAPPPPSPDRDDVKQIFPKSSKKSKKKQPPPHLKLVE